jgi:glycerol-3-phosphate cytidylyltransferase
MSFKILTYGTFDLFHYGHERILSRAADLGTQLFVGISSDSFNAIKGKQAFQAYGERAEHIQDFVPFAHVFAENSFDQKVTDIRRFDIDMLVMGDDWEGKFDYLRDICQVRYLKRTAGISSTLLRKRLAGKRDGLSR